MDIFKAELGDFSHIFNVDWSTLFLQVWINLTEYWVSFPEAGQRTNFGESRIDEAVETPHCETGNRSVCRALWFAWWCTASIFDQPGWTDRRLWRFARCFCPVVSFSQTAIDKNLEDRETVAELLGQLNPEVQEVVRLKIFSGLTFKEVGEIVGVPEQTAATKYRRALEKLRKYSEAKSSGKAVRGSMVDISKSDG